MNQKKCVFGFVLPDRCLYVAHLGCDCGEYPTLWWDEETRSYKNPIEHGILSGQTNT